MMMIGIEFYERGAIFAKQPSHCAAQTADPLHISKWKIALSMIIGRFCVRDEQRRERTWLDGF